MHTKWVCVRFTCTSTFNRKESNFLIRLLVSPNMSKHQLLDWKWNSPKFFHEEKMNKSITTFASTPLFADPLNISSVYLGWIRTLILKLYTICTNEHTRTLPENHSIKRLHNYGARSFKNLFSVSDLS